ncbi:MAG: ABC transporter permease [Thalassobaculales bacterium]
MIHYTVQRLGLAAVIVLSVLVLMFVMMHLVPGDPASVLLGPRATPEMVEDLHRRMGLDQPLHVQILRFLASAASGDLGRDPMSGEAVAAAVLSQVPYTAALAVAGLGWAIALGVPLGCYSAVRRGTLADRISGIVSVGAIAVPSFVVALYALLIFCVALPWFPAIGAGAPGDILDQLWHLVLPAFAIGLGWVGYLARLVRASMLEVLGEKHIRTARAFGLAERRIVYHYALKLAVLPVVTVLGVGLGRLLSGAVFAEIVFSRPGVGRLVYDAVVTRNAPVVVGGVLVTTMIFVLCTLAADLLNAALDPRVRDRLRQ